MYDMTCPVSNVSQGVSKCCVLNSQGTKCARLISFVLSSWVRSVHPCVSSKYVVPVSVVSIHVSNHNQLRLPCVFQVYQYFLNFLFPATFAVLSGMYPFLFALAFVLVWWCTSLTASQKFSRRQWFSSLTASQRFCDETGEILCEFLAWKWWRFFLLFLFVQVFFKRLFI